MVSQEVSYLQYTGGKAFGKKGIKPRPTKADYASVVRENEVLKAQVAKYAKEKRKIHSFVQQPEGYSCLSNMMYDDEEEMGVVIPKEETVVLDEDEDECLVDSDKPQKRKTGLGSKMSHHLMSQGKIGRRHLRYASENTGKLLDMIPSPRSNFPSKVLKKLVQMNDEYLLGNDFKADLIMLCNMAKPLLEKEPRCLRLQSPCHVFGDIHGNMDELHFFNEVIWNKGINLTPGKFVFLGDYVDRGMQGMECVAYLLALKIRNPTKVYLLRGNHELRDVNSWNDFYGDRCLISQCVSRYGSQRGILVWETINDVFDRLPLAAVIDEDIFCIHGGIPRPVDGMSEIDLITKVPNVAGVTPPYPYENPVLCQAVHQCLWSDPVKSDEELRMDETGFGSNPRGARAQCYGRTAVDSFLSKNGFSYIIRAHEKTKDGMCLSKDARVITVFSTSKDHNLGQQALAACLLIDDCRIEVITKDPGYQRRRRVFMESMSSSSFHILDNFGTLDIRPGENNPVGFNENRKNSKEVQRQSNLSIIGRAAETQAENGGYINGVEHLSGNNNLNIGVPGLVNNRFDLTPMEGASVCSGLKDPLQPRCLDINRRDSLDPDDFQKLRMRSQPVRLHSPSMIEGAAPVCDKDHFSRNGETADGSSSATTYNRASCGQNAATITSKPKSRESGNRFINVVSSWAKHK